MTKYSISKSLSNYCVTKRQSLQETEMPKPSAVIGRDLPEIADIQNVDTLTESHEKEERSLTNIVRNNKRTETVTRDVTASGESVSKRLLERTFNTKTRIERSHITKTSSISKRQHHEIADNVDREEIRVSRYTPRVKFSIDDDEGREDDDEPSGRGKPALTTYGGECAVSGKPEVHIMKFNLGEDILNVEKRDYFGTDARQETKERDDFTGMGRSFTTGYQRPIPMTSTSTGSCVRVHGRSTEDDTVNETSQSPSPSAGDVTDMLLNSKEGTNRSMAPVHRGKLLAEIAELEENAEDYDPSSLAHEDKSPLNAAKCTCSHSSPKHDTKPVQQTKDTRRRKGKRRSLSLPTGNLSLPPGARILYRDGHFVIEVVHPEEAPPSSNQKAYTRSRSDTVSSENEYDGNEGIAISPKKAMHSDQDEEVFVDNLQGSFALLDDQNSDGKETSTIRHIFVPRRASDKRRSGGKIPRPVSADESQLQQMLAASVDENDNSELPTVTSTPDLKNKARRSSSLRESTPDYRSQTLPTRRSSSFREAQDQSPCRLSDSNDSQYCPSRSLSVDESADQDLNYQNPKHPGFFQRMLSKRRSFNEKNQGLGTKSVDLPGKESLIKKSFRQWFKKSKSETAPNSSPCPSAPTSPPIAAFQSDEDIHSVGSTPNSPYTSQRFPRRHTSADLFSQAFASALQKPDDSYSITSSINTNEDDCDGLSITSLNIQSSHHKKPKRPKSPKPPSDRSPLVRNPNSQTSRDLSQTHSPVKCSLSLDSTDSVFYHEPDSQGTKVSVQVDTNSGTLSGSKVSGNVQDRKLYRQDAAVSPPDVDKMASLGQGEMASSNSNDSGIQHDSSVHSSNESLKVIPDTSYSAVRRRKSPSPNKERPKSEITVRWADLEESATVAPPVKRRETNNRLRNRPRPQSDIEENIQLFDELFDEVLEDFDDSGGSSSLLSETMKAFETLQQFASLRNLDELRRQEAAYKNKPTKSRRMSTPHPIKSRLQHSPPKQKKQYAHALVRCHSMPDRLDKLRKQRKLNSLLDLHTDLLSQHVTTDDSSDESDIGVDHISLHESLSARSSNAQLSTLDEMPEQENTTYAEALWDHITMDPEELAFRAGDVIEVKDMDNKDWWWGVVDDHEGWLPASFVRLRVNQDEYEDDLTFDLPDQFLAVVNVSPKLRRISVINKDQARANVVNEIISAEQEYVKHLKDVVDGYIRHARRRSEMFSEDRISVIFGNMEEIYKFSSAFIKELETCINSELPYLSEIGGCFLRHKKGFEIYSDYCNNHPSACEELKELYQNKKYRHFFEACRLLQEMIEIPLEGFLLTPVQKICKYPLQLAELLKYTPPEHCDYHKVRDALEAMKTIAALINERKRKLESIETIAAWQLTVEDWEGPDLLEGSSELIYSGEANKINTNGWSQERYFFLFDHQLIYCKKDLLTRNVFRFKGRVNLDECDVVPLDDGKDTQYNVTVKNAWKLWEHDRDKFYLLYTKTSAQKQRWLKAFQDERSRVKQDQENEFAIPSHWKQTVLNKLNSHSGKEKQAGRSTGKPSALVYNKDLLRGISGHATLPRTLSSQHNEKKRGWFPFGKKHKH